MNGSRQRLAHARIATALGPHAVIAAIVAAAALPLIVVACLVPPALVLPVLSIAFLAAAGVLALIACCIRSDRNSKEVSVWDLSGACAFIGFAVGIFSTPENVLAVFGHAAGG